MRTIVGGRAEYEQEARAARGTLVARSRLACDELKRAMAEAGVG